MANRKPSWDTPTFEDAEMTPPAVQLRAAYTDSWLPTMSTYYEDVSDQQRHLLLLGCDVHTNAQVGCYLTGANISTQLRYAIGTQNVKVEEVKDAQRCRLLYPFEEGQSWPDKQWRVFVRYCYDRAITQEGFELTEEHQKNLVDSIKQVHAIWPPRFALREHKDPHPQMEQDALDIIQTFLADKTQPWTHMESLVLSESDWKQYLVLNAENPVYTPWEWINGLRLQGAFDDLGACIAEPGQANITVQYLEALDMRRMGTLPPGFIRASDKARFKKFFQPSYEREPRKLKPTKLSELDNVPSIQTINTNRLPLSARLLPAMLARKFKDQTMDELLEDEPLKRMASYRFDKDDILEYISMFLYCVDVSTEHRTIKRKLNLPPQPSQSRTPHQPKDPKWFDFNIPIQYPEQLANPDKGKGPARPREEYHQPANQDVEMNDLVRPDPKVMPETENELTSRAGNHSTTTRGTSPALANVKGT